MAKHWARPHGKKEIEEVMTERLGPELLRRRCDESQFDFGTTAEVKDSAKALGLERAVNAIRFGLEIEREGYNIYALGPAGLGKHAIVRRFLEERSAGMAAPSDWCYINNFKNPQTPKVLRLPSGMGSALSQDLASLMEEVQSAIPALFESEDYQTRKHVIEEEFNERREKAIAELQAEAEKKGLTLLRTPMGLAFGPVKEGEVMSPDEYRQLPEEEQKRVDAAIAEMQTKLQQLMRQMPRWEKEGREKIKKLDQEVAVFALGHLVDELRKKYEELPEVVEHLEALQQDVVDNLDLFFSSEKKPPPGLQALMPLGASEMGPLTRRYGVNVVVDNRELQGAPVVYEDNPTYPNLVGRVEHISANGALITDFNLIRGGSLHRANGGYLLLDADKLLRQPFSWDGLKRALRSGQIRVESLGQALSLISTVSLEPTPIPLDVKVILVGDRFLYYLLCMWDPDFDQLFKVSADFEETVDRRDGNDRRYANLVAALAEREKLLPLDRGAVARVVERGARWAGDGEKLSIHQGQLVDLLREADFWARKSGADAIDSSHVQKAVDAQIHRSNRLQERLQEQIERGVILIDTDGARIGQVNGLSVIQLGKFSFGRPSRITARVRLGKGEVIDIEREVELGGPLHSKGVLILGGYLGARYAVDFPLSLSATLVFEQSYGGVDGDSASSAELYALLSALAEAPIKQSLAVTGSVNQHGRIQAIGGVNEKIEGFFDLCKARGLNGEQGVLIPASNETHLMLRQDVVKAVEENRFHIHAVETVDQGIQILTGEQAGERDDAGRFPEGSLNARIESRLRRLAEKQARHARLRKGDDNGG